VLFCHGSISLWVLAITIIWLATASRALLPETSFWRRVSSPPTSLWIIGILSLLIVLSIYFSFGSFSFSVSGRMVVVMMMMTMGPRGGAQKEH
jgi:hypothetical protein